MTHKYEIRMYWSDEDEAFIAAAPELPGCFADGPTHEDATREIEVVMGLWIDLAKELGWEIPEPRAAADSRPLSAPLARRVRDWNGK